VTGVSAPQRLLICDDSRVFAEALRRTLEFDGDIVVVAVCGSAEDAIAAVPRVDPDLVTMDVELPGMDGLAAVEEIMSSRPLPILVLSGHVARGGDKAAAALAAGALDAVAKTDLDLRDPAGALAVAFRRRVKVLCRARVIRHPRGHLRARGPLDAPARGASVIGICASTGGPQVLARLLEALPAGYPIPLLVVQHITAGFTDGLARWLNRAARLPVGVARDGVRAGPGAHIAPEGAHLKLTPGGRLALDRHTVAGPHRPSGDVLLESIAVAAGRSGVAVVLTGMGTDGAAGAAVLHQRGGLVIAQDEASSAVYGMPKAATARGADAVLPPDGIAARLLRLSPERLAGAR
jgi:two-component system, chemotaxis family, protein-glutamate methylesterase/glutaminase